MKVKIFAVLSFLICFLAAIPPIVSASDNTEVYVITLDSAGNSYYMESFGNGTFTPQEYIGGGSVSGGYNYGNGIGDFDNDGDFDYIMGSDWGSIWLYEKLGPGNQFALPVEVGSWAEGNYPMDIAVADFNEDGKLDFILIQYASLNCELYTGDGELGFTRSVIPDATPKYSAGVDAADFNNDGHADFIAATYGNSESYNYFYVNLGHGNGTFETIKFASYRYTMYWGIAAGDFDGDGIVDFAATDGGIIDIYLGAGDGSFDYGHRIYDAGVYKYYASVDNYDFNGDGNQDIVIGRYGTGRGVGVFLGDGEGMFTHSETYFGGSYYDRYAISAPPYMQNEKPVAIVAPAYQEITVGEVVFVNAEGSDDADGEIVSYTWTFEEEGFSEAGTFSAEATSVSEGFSAEHVYYQAGLYTITLTVTDDMGATSSVTAQVNVTALGAQIKFNPRTLNLKSRGKWVRATIKLPSGFDASRIDLGSVCISEKQTCLIYADSDSNFTKKKAGKRFTKKNARKLKVKFDRQALLEKLAGPAGKKTLHVQGLVSPKSKRSFVSFEGSGTIRTIEPHKKDRKNKKSKNFKKFKD
ncbi:MAG: VCBS repeat-containing protein [Proteobacteria bacterium]|nr:VCBS repeat-containing protein [Pseudomonadota bacterium]